MTSDEFAGKIKQKYPQYNSLSNQDLTNKMIAKYPQYKEQVQITPEDKLNPVAKTIAGVGQNIGGFAKDIGLGGVVDLVAHGGPAQAVQHATGVNPLLNSQTLQQEQQQPLQNIAGDVGGAAAMLGGGELLGLGGKALSKFGTQKALLKGYDAAHAASSKLGLTKNWDDIANTVRQKAQQGANAFSPDLQREVEAVLSKRTPAPTVAGEAPVKAGVGSYVKNVKYTSKQLHDFRKALDNSIPKTAWGQNVNIRPVGVQANQLVRGVLSDAMHEIAPETHQLDKIYSLYSNPFFQKTAIPLTSIGFDYPKQLAGIPSATINAALSALGLETVGKKFGL